MITHNALINELKEHVNVLEQTCRSCELAIAEIERAIVQCLQRGNKLMLCGNGGSAADAQHVAAEFINRFRLDRPPLPAIALTTDTSILTAVGNDSVFDCIFSRQVEAIGQPGDILVGISTSGHSSNVLRALEVARAQKVITIGFTSMLGIQFMQPKCDFTLVVPAADTARIQEAHEFVWHYICGAVESEIFPQKPPGE